MNKILYGALLGGVLGIPDGLSALLTAPETKPMILQIVCGAIFKGLVAGAIIGFFSRKVQSVGAGVVFGLVIGALLASGIAAIPNPDGSHYWWQLMVPGALFGAIVGYATQVHAERKALAS